MAGYWIEPKGKTHAIPHFMHEAFAKSRGARGIYDLIRQGWIRTISHEGSFNFQLSTYKDDSALDRIEDFLAAESGSFERWAVTLETENPLEPPVHLMDRDIRDMGLKEAVARAVRMHRITRPFGMMGAETEEVEFYGETVSYVETPRGVRRSVERFWYDPETDDIICERMVG